MKVIDTGHIYEMTQLGGGTQRITFRPEFLLVEMEMHAVLQVLLERTRYLNRVLPCAETKDAIEYLRMISYGAQEEESGYGQLKVIDEGHVYQFGEDTQKITFVKRSGGAVTYQKEWPGVQTQEVLRVLIDRTKYLNEILPCIETQDDLYYLRMALFMYEVRAWRRKQEKVNRAEPAHDDSERPRSWRDLPFADVPFNEIDVELRPIGEDGHIVVDQGIT